MNVLRKLSLLPALMILSHGLWAKPASSYFDRSYAIVIGIGNYQHSERWHQLKNNENDADEMAKILEDRGFQVRIFKGEDATKSNIESHMEDYLALNMGVNDRLVFYFSGHGETQTIGSEAWGYVIPYDGGRKSSTWISMSRLRTLASMMGSAKHQLFIFDACFGGAFALKSSSLSAIPTTAPNYVYVITKARARQYLTAGGAKEQTPAQSNLPGYTQFSYYTAHLIKALKENTGDITQDGVITSDELYTYLGKAALSQYNTPRGGNFAGHEQGNFVFQNTSNLASGLAKASFISADSILKGRESNAQNEAQQTRKSSEDNDLFYFETDSSRLTVESRSKLAIHIERIMATKQRVRLEGHTDERGTPEYNRALGERNAKAVKNYLIIKGVNPDQIETISYGEDAPALAESNEAAWALNRRVEIVYLPD
ncbi:MAG: caspase family protein [Pseudomonadota bacterium]|nr:caspase family protein [Pseudomonadota bacterium]